MHNHFDKGLNLKSWILERRPKHIVECGAGDGELSRKIDSLHSEYDFKFSVISDKRPDNISGSFTDGISYVALDSYPDDSIDLCIIDTDHNYWTLMKELAAVFNKIPEGGLIALHDVETFYHNTGMALSYWNGSPYPREEIEKYAPYGGLGDALIDFLQSQKMKYKLLFYTPEFHGAALIEKQSHSIFSIVVPGPGAGFAPKPETKEVLHASV